MWKALGYNTDDATDIKSISSTNYKQILVNEPIKEVIKLITLTQFLESNKDKILSFGNWRLGDNELFMMTNDKKDPLICSFISFSSEKETTFYLRNGHIFLISLHHRSNGKINIKLNALNANGNGHHVLYDTYEWI